MLKQKSKESNMNITNFSNTYRVSLLTSADVEIIYNLCIKNPIYYKYCPPTVTVDSIQSDMAALPPNKTMEDKYYVGYFDDAGNLIAVMDFIDKYPDERTAFIGFFMVNADFQGRGIGSFLISELFQYLKSQGYERIRLGYVKGNEQSRNFWLKNGFQDTGIRNNTDAYTVVVMNRYISFSENIYFGYIIKGDLLGAIHYVKQFPEQAELYNRFMYVFEQGQNIRYAVDDELNEILATYQQYYRDVFYFCVGKESAEEKLRAKLVDSLGINDKNIALCDLEQNQIADIFQSRGFYFMGGKSSGYYGPYIWKSTETKKYEVELPDGIQIYTIKLLDGFIANSWMDYLSFGKIGTGGWSDGDGIIHCVKSSYDFESENFKVSLLKHEAQHARDLAIHKDMSSEELEYRAKLVELIYSKERNMLQRFAQEADVSDKSNGHSAASSRIIEGFGRKLNLTRAEIEKLPVTQVQKIASALLEESNY